MRKTKLKLKKQVWICFIILLFLAIAIYAGNKIYQDYLYKQTEEYKLLEIGYTDDEIKLLEEKTNEATIKKILADSTKNELLLEIIQETYYIADNLERYLTFAESNSSYTTNKIVALVNTNNDYAYYDHDIDTDTTKDYLLLVNKYYHLTSDYVPTDLVNISNKYYYGENHKIRKVVYDAFIEMWNAAYQENIYLIINSSYRNYESQVSVYDDYKNSHGTTYADKLAARPGYSEHQTGLALDIFSKDSTTTSSFASSSAHAWLQNNAYRFGFIERYQEGKEDITGFAAESWHWRYVGIEAATYIYNNNITFDEYYAYFIET